MSGGEDKVGKALARFDRVMAVIDEREGPVATQARRERQRKVQRYGRAARNAVLALLVVSIATIVVGVVTPIGLFGFLAAVALALLLMLFSGLVYHFVFLKAAREGWPVVSAIVRLVIRDEVQQRDRFVRENLDAIATKVGEMQAKLLKLEAMGDRVSGTSLATSITQPLAS